MDCASAKTVCPTSSNQDLQLLQTLFFWVEEIAANSGIAGASRFVNVWRMQ
jgi:hypothetical protein